MIATMFQDPNGSGPDVIQQLELLGWVDRTALAVLVVFFVIGLFKGLIWQVSRILILVVAYAIAGRFGTAVGDFLARTPAVGGTAGPLPVDTPETTLYLAYVLLFLAVLVVLSLCAMLIQKLAAKAGLGFFDRLGGGLLGTATGACVVLFCLFVVHMFFRGSQLAEAAEGSHSLRLSRTAIDWLGTSVPDDLRTVFALTPLQATAGPLQVDPSDPPGATMPTAPSEAAPGEPATGAPAVPPVVPPRRPGG